MRRIGEHWKVGLSATAVVSVLTACSGGTSSNSDSVIVEGSIPIAYVKRPVSSLGDPTDSVGDSSGNGGDLYIREVSSPSASETNVTGSETQGQGDVADPEVSYDGNRIIFAMRRRPGERWGIWEFDRRPRPGQSALRRINCDATDINGAAIPGDDVDPAYLRDGRIVFSSNRQETTWKQMQRAGRTPYKYLDEYEREAVTVLHVMNSDGSNCKQISFNQSHDRNPTQRMDGTIMYSRWDHVGGRNQFSIFKINPDGTNPFILYGAHDLDDIYLHPREMQDGRVISSYMPLSGTREGGSLEIIDLTNYTGNNTAGSPNPPPNQLGEQRGQFQLSRLLFPGEAEATHTAMRGRGISPLGRYSGPYPLWDGTGRILVAYTMSQPTTERNQLGQDVPAEGTPRYGIDIIDLATRRNLPVVLPQDGFFYSDPVALMARPLPNRTTDYTPDTALGAGVALLNVNTVYDTDNLERMGNAVLVSGESIPRTNGRVDIVGMKTPGNANYASRVARFFRITKAVPTPGGMSREALGETEFEMQQIVGYGVIEPDGSLRGKVPADQAINITAVDREGRAFTPHVNWIQAREGERRFCKGCHSSRLAADGSSTTDATGTLLNNTSANPNPSPSNPSVDGTGTMAELRTLTDPTALRLRPNLFSQDYWTSRFNTRYSTSHGEQPDISIDYAGAPVQPAIKGPAGCSWTNWAFDEATFKDCSIAINYLDHIQPIWERARTGGSCVSCHSGAAPSGGLDLSGTEAGVFGRAMSYQRLMVGEPVLDCTTNQAGQQVCTPRVELVGDELRVVTEPEAVSAGSARASRLVARLYEQPLRAGSIGTANQPSISRPVCAPGANPASAINGATSCQNHAGMLNASELRLVNEWADMGGQYYNDQYDSSGQLRTNVARLSLTVFTCAVQPVLRANCATCHQPTNGGQFDGSSRNNRYVLTGNADNDFSATASMVTDVNTPANSLLLTRPTNLPHPNYQTLMPAGSLTYNTIRDWIAGTLTCQ